jgi:hypothetical protein
MLPLKLASKYDTKIKYFSTLVASTQIILFSEILKNSKKLFLKESEKSFGIFRYIYIPKWNLQN